MEGSGSGGCASLVLVPLVLWYWFCSCYDLFDRSGGHSQHSRACGGAGDGSSTTVGRLALLTRLGYGAMPYARNYFFLNHSQFGGSFRYL